MTVSPSSQSPGSPACSCTRGTLAAQAASLVVFFLVAAAVPLGLRALNRSAGTARVSESYFPAVMAPRERRPFDARAVEGIRGAQPRYVVIGDSMGGSRIDHRRLGELAGAGVVPIFSPATGSVFWYLAFKNLVVASGARPRAAIFFFRDEILTDPMFRLNTAALDRVAHDREPEVNEILAASAQGTFFRVHALLRDAYEFDRTRAWAEPLISGAPVGLAAAPRFRPRLLQRMNKELFALDALRPMTAADITFGDPDKFDFQGHLPISVLPLIIRDAKAAGITPAFIRVQRRPVGGRPPAQSAELAEYMRQLRSYLRANGAYFNDEWGDPELPLSIYSDGDHIGRPHKRHTTELFYRRNPGLFQ